MDEATVRENRRRFFEAGVERIREMRGNMEAMAAEAVKADMPDSSFDEWRAALNRQEKGFQAQVDRLR